ncbi:hypothetical protein KXS11_02230 [Plantibacter flavus]|uniref:hypothetical protein n=1 Tax=Plantibacter flavus TaxID=150123 RepID=UPI003F15501B
MPDTDTAIDELLVSESVEAPSAARNGLVVAVALVVILAIATTVTAVLFAPVVQTMIVVFFSWVFGSLQSV